MSREIIYSLKKYQEEYPTLLNLFCKNTEFDEIDFIITEIDFHRIYLTSVSIYKRIRYRMVGDPFLDEDTIFLSGNTAIYDIISDAIKTKSKNDEVDNIIASYKIHFNKIISFLEQRKSGFATELKKETPINSFPENNIEIDLSNTNAVQKIIYINELGIIDFLRNKQPFNTSINSLATVLTAITGENQKTLQPYLNALLSNTGAENNNPYKTKSTIEKVKNKLISIGFKVD